MIKDKLHPTNIIAGYKIAVREACKYIEVTYLFVNKF